MEGEIPTTKLRQFYDLLSLFSYDTQIDMIADFNRKDKYKELINIYKESKTHFKKYSNIYETFISKEPRKPLTETKGLKFKNTRDVIEYLKNKKTIQIINDPSLEFLYIEREIDPRRTRKAKFDTGKSGKSSGIGGLDFIAWNIPNKKPILGEIKCNADKTPFYAMIQLFMFCSELSTPNQIERVNRQRLFERDIGKHPKFLLYVILADFNLRGKNSIILKETMKLANKLNKKIFEIHDIVFLEMNKSRKQIIRKL